MHALWQEMKLVFSPRTAAAAAEADPAMAGQMPASTVGSMGGGTTQLEASVDATPLARGTETGGEGTESAASSRFTIRFVDMGRRGQLLLVALTAGHTRRSNVILSAHLPARMTCTPFRCSWSFVCIRVCGCFVPKDNNISLLLACPALVSLLPPTRCCPPLSNDLSAASPHPAHTCPCLNVTVAHS